MFCKTITQSNRDRKVPLHMVYLMLKFCMLKPGFSFLKGLFRMNAKKGKWDTKKMKMYITIKMKYPKLSGGGWGGQNKTT